MESFLPPVFLSNVAHDKRLSGQWFGRVCGSRNRQGWEKWALVPSPHGGFFVDSLAHFNERLQCISDSGHVKTVNKHHHAGTWESFKLDRGEGDAAVFLVNVEHKRKLACNEHEHVYGAEKSHAGTWESWRVERAPFLEWYESDKFWAKVSGSSLGALTLGIYINALSGASWISTDNLLTAIIAHNHKGVFSF